MGSLAACTCPTLFASLSSRVCLCITTVQSYPQATKCVRNLSYRIKQQQFTDYLEFLTHRIYFLLETAFFILLISVFRTWLVRFLATMILKRSKSVRLFFASRLATFLAQVVFFHASTTPDLTTASFTIRADEPRPKGTWKSVRDSQRIGICCRSTPRNKY